ncbi:hypothetical protein [Streptomyces shenzhenensis]|uniref:hypothetical protein n=1 Tax=Streptomyces shenzhenensis TaxID=943815 RepID=UPI0033D3816B
MSRPAHTPYIVHTLHVAYGAAFAWLAHCAVQSARNDAPWVAVLFLAVSCLFVVAAAREGRLLDAPPRTGATATIRAARVFRTVGGAARKPRGSAPTSRQPRRACPPGASEYAVEDRIALGWNDLEAVCCLRSWESYGVAHDPLTCTRKDATDVRDTTA